MFHQTSPRIEEDDALQDPTNVLVVERMMTILVLDIRNVVSLDVGLALADLPRLVEALKG